MQYLVTGGLGFIGHRLCLSLLESGHAVRVMDNLATNCAAPEFFSSGACKISLGDVADWESCLRNVSGVDAIVHLAAQTSVQVSLADPGHDLRTNVDGTLKLLEAARRSGVKRFVFASSNAVFGQQELPLREDMTACPRSPYGVSKLAAESYCRLYYEHFALQTISLRFANVYGPGSDRKNSVIATLMKSVLAGHPLQVYGDGLQTRDFIYVDDIVQALRLALTSDCGGEVFTVGTGVATSVLEVVQLMVRVLRADSWAGETVRVEHLPPRPGDVRRNYSLIAKARALLGYEPRVDLTLGLMRTWEWFRQRWRPVG